MSLATTKLESIANRRNHVLDAINFRRQNLRKAKQASLSQAKLERINQRYFLGEQPF
ncbi:TPA: hypothetical protein SK287_004453 [Yersinia enterocolitica]|nr:hypothetical protein [Yersinia enterocolitica]